MNKLEPDPRVTQGTGFFNALIEWMRRAALAVNALVDGLSKAQIDINGKVSKAGDTMSGDLLLLSTPATSDNSTKAVSSSWIRGAMLNIATAAGFVISLGTNASYVKFPSWLGSWLIQFGTLVGTTGGSGNITVTFPVAFVDNRASVASNGDASAGNEPTTIANSSTTGMNVLFVGLGAGAARRANWIAVGN